MRCDITNSSPFPTWIPPHLTYRALRLAKASGECLPLSRLEIITLSRLPCDPMPPPPPLGILGVEVLFPLFLRNGLRLPVRVDELADGTGMVALRLDGNAPVPEKMSSDGAGEMVLGDVSVGSGIEGRGGFCGARWG